MAQRLGFLSRRARRLQIDASGDGYFVSYPGERQVLASTLKAGAAGQRIVLRTGAPVSSFWLADNGEQIAVLDDTGALRVGSLAQRERASATDRFITETGESGQRRGVRSIGQWLVAALERQGLRMWDLTGPPDAEPMVLGRGAATRRSAPCSSQPGDG